MAIIQLGPLTRRFDDIVGQPREERLLYVDQLRVIAVAGVFLIHVCEVLTHLTSGTSPTRSAAVSLVKSR
jgi:hypothetical protein